MAFDDEDSSFLDEQDLKPEDVFSMVTVMPKRKIKVVAHLEDPEGEQVIVSELAENLTKYINEEMKRQESTPVNSQLFPMAGQFMTSIVPRFVGLQIGSIMFEAGAFRHALLTFGLASMLFMQYVQQHNLKIVTTTIDLSEDEVEAYLERSREANRRLKNALETAFGVDENGNEEPEDPQ